MHIWWVALAKKKNYYRATVPLVLLSQTVKQLEVTCLACRPALMVCDLAKNRVGKQVLRTHPKYYLNK